MKAERISLTNKEQIILQAMIYLKIQHNEKAEKPELEQLNTTEELKTLYEKIAGFEYKDTTEELKALYEKIAGFEYKD